MAWCIVALKSVTFGSKNACVEACMHACTVDNEIDYQNSSGWFKQCPLSWHTRLYLYVHCYRISIPIPMFQCSFTWRCVALSDRSTFLFTFLRNRSVFNHIPDCNPIPIIYPCWSAQSSPTSMLECQSLLSSQTAISDQQWFQVTK